MAQQSEIIALVLAAAFVPVVVWTYRGIMLPLKPLLAAGLVAMLGAYAATVIESFVAPDFLNIVEHLLYAAASTCFAIFSVAVLRDHLRSAGRDG